MIRVILPTYLQRLANVGREVSLNLEGEITIQALLDELEKDYPMLKGTIRDQATNDRRDYLRFFACAKDLSHLPQNTSLPKEVVEQNEPFRIVGAISGG